MNIYEKLAKVQQELKAPKSKFNKFGNYYYRNCEDILEGAKSSLEKYKATIVLTDEIAVIGQRVYIKATASFYDLEKEDRCIFNNAYAREDESKKGMDGSQITGAASSYARKYALNGLLLIDDTNDADSNEYQNQQYQQPQAPQQQWQQPQQQPAAPQQKPTFANEDEEINYYWKLNDKYKVVINQTRKDKRISELTLECKQTLIKALEGME